MILHSNPKVMDLNSGPALILFIHSNNKVTKLSETAKLSIAINSRPTTTEDYNYFFGERPRIHECTRRSVSLRQRRPIVLVTDDVGTVARNMWIEASQDH